MCSYCGLCVNRTFFQTYVYAPDLITRLGHNAHDYTPPLARVLTLPSTILSSSCLSSLQSRVTAFVLSPATAVTARGSNGPELQLPPWSASDGNEEILCLSHLLSFSRLPFWLFLSSLHLLFVSTLSFQPCCQGYIATRLCGFSLAPSLPIQDLYPSVLMVPASHPQTIMR